MKEDSTQGAHKERGAGLSYIAPRLKNRTEPASKESREAKRKEGE